MPKNSNNLKPEDKPVEKPPETTDSIIPDPRLENIVQEGLDPKNIKGKLIGEIKEKK